MDEKVYNPTTGRYIKVGGQVYNRLVRQGIITPPVFLQNLEKPLASEKPLNALAPYYGPLSIIELYHEILNYCDLATAINLSQTCGQLHTNAESIIIYKILEEKSLEDEFIIHYHIKEKIRKLPLTLIRRLLTLNTINPKYFVDVNKIPTPEYCQYVLDPIKNFNNVYISEIDSDKLIEIIKRGAPNIPNSSVVSLVNYKSLDDILIIFGLYLPMMRLAKPGKKITIGEVMDYLAGCHKYFHHSLKNIDRTIPIN